jgi:hypothetical protein
VRELAPVSKHRLFRDGPLLFYEQHEFFTLADAQTSTVLYTQIIEEEGYLLLLLDFRKGGAVDADVRRHLAHWAKANAEHCCIAAVGGNFVLRTTLTLVLTAARVLGGRQLQVQFFSTTEAGQTWLAARGASLAAAQRKAPAPNSE